MGPLQWIIGVAAVASAAAIIFRQLTAVRSARAQRETGRFARDIIDNAGEGIVVYDRQLRYVLWNRFMRELTGLGPEDVLGRRANEVFPHLSEQQIDLLLQRALLGETVSSPDVHYLVPSTNRQGWISAVYRPYIDDDGEILGVAALIRDITERKAAEQQIEYQSRSTQERMTVESGLHSALEAGQFVLLYQPQIDVESGEIVGMEALIRWNHPERGIILPEDFISVAEERRLILPIGDWVLRQACRDVRRFHDRGMKHFRVAVNLSARQFRDVSLAAAVESALADAGVSPKNLELEITETVAMENVDLTMSTLQHFRRAGVTIAIDDFGTGHSSLSYLKRFPLDALKIDRAFVTDLPDSFEDAAIVSSVIQLANGLGLRVVAEGVETTEQLDFLKDAGCREVQGFYFSYPVTVEEVEELVARPIQAVVAKA